MIVAGLVGMTLTVAALRADQGGTEVAVATHEIRAGEVIRARDFRVDRIRAGRDLLGTIVGGHRRSRTARRDRGRHHRGERGDPSWRSAGAGRGRGAPGDEHPDRPVEGGRRSTRGG